MRFGQLAIFFAMSTGLVVGQVLLPPDHPSVSVDSLDFGSMAPGKQSESRTVVVSYPNVGVALSDDFINIIGIRLSDSNNFLIRGGTCPIVSTDGFIPSGYHLNFLQSCTIEVEFWPTSSGISEASLDIYSNNGKGNPYTCWDITQCPPWPGQVIPQSLWIKTTVRLKGYAGDKSQPSDFDGDGKRDFAVWRPSDGNWYVVQSGSSQISVQQWGLPGDIPVSGDFDGDGTSDYAVWRPTNGTWYVVQSNSAQIEVQQWGLQGDMPLRGDFDGDGRTDYAVWRASNGTWYIIRSSDRQIVTQQWGLPGDVPICGDFDRDSKTDYAVWRPSDGIWYVIYSSNGQLRFQQWGLTGDIPVSADFDGDGQTDYAVWRPENGLWYVVPSSDAQRPYARQWGLRGDVPMPGDFDSDGRTDFTVWRPATGMWYTIPSTAAEPVHYRPVRRFPTSAFDLSVVADLRRPVAQIQRELTRLGGDALVSIDFVRQYAGPPLEQGQKSVSYRIEIGAADRTLTNEEVSEVRALLIEGMRQAGYELRV